MFLLITIFIIFYLIFNNNKLKNENLKLKSMLNKKHYKFCPSCGFDLINNKHNSSIESHVVNSLSSIASTSYANHDINHINKNQKKKLDDKEFKNTLILIVGSVLVVLSAVIFLTSSWNIVHNFVKTGVIVLMLIVFFIVSHIAEKYFKLSHVSKTFYYIALAYIPIVLMSISMFGLFGSFLSLYGAGRYIYLLFSCLIVYYIYYENALERDSLLLYVFSLIFQVLSIIFFVLIFNNESKYLLCAFAIYSTIISFLYAYKVFYFKKEIHYNLSLGLCLLNLAFTLLYCILSSTEILSILLLVIVFVNIHLVLTSVHKDKALYDIIYPIFIIFTFYKTSILFDSIIINQILIFISFSIVGLYNYLLDKKLNITVYLEVLIAFGIFSIYWIVSSFGKMVMIDYYIMSLLFMLYSYIQHKYMLKDNDIPLKMFIISIVISTFSFVYKFELPYYIVSYISLVLFILSDYYKDKMICKTLKYTGLITIILFTFFNFSLSIIGVLFYLLFSITSYMFFIKDRNEFFKFTSYIYLNIFIFFLLRYIGYEQYKYIIPFTSIVFMFIEEFIKTGKSQSSNAYILIQSIISVIILTFDDTLFNFILLVIFNIIYSLYFIKNENDSYLLTSFLSMIPYLYMSDILVINNINFMNLISYAIIILLFLLSYFKKINMYITLLWVFTILFVMFIDVNKYVNIFILIINSILCYFIKTEKTKVIYKGLLYILLLLLTNFIISDLNFDGFVLFSHGIYLVFAFFFIKNIVSEFDINIKILEYIVYSFINLLAIGGYASEIDGMIFVMLLLVFVVSGYIYKLGPVFLVSLVFILFNIILLTREFWFSVPWWIYLLLLGSLLIGFAVYNEIKNKEGSNVIKEKIDEIKNNFDL